jgi:hypothetical protein
MSTVVRMAITTTAATEQWEVVSGHRGCGGTGSLELGERISASVADAVVAE